VTGKAAKMPKQTEASMIALLHERYGASSGNGPRYAGMAHVRSDAGFDATRTADYIAIDLWPSKGLALHGHEVKISRSDWLNELKDPEKSGAFMKHVDYWWLVIADAAMVKDGELPDGWGMMAVGSDGKLRVVKQAPRLNKVDLPPERNSWGGLKPAVAPVHRGLVAAMLRSSARTAAAATHRSLQGEHEEWIATHEPGPVLYEVWGESTISTRYEGPRRWRVRRFDDREAALGHTKALNTDLYDETGYRISGRYYHAEQVQQFSYQKREGIYS
jgi:hypothetical protein